MSLNEDGNRNFQLRSQDDNEYSDDNSSRGMPPGTLVYSRGDFEGNRNRAKDQLGRATVFLLIVNRMIGTGIFELPSTILAGSGSLGASLLLWVLGGIIAFCGLLVHIEFGLMVPRYHDQYGRNWKCIPRSGGEKNYFEYLFAKLDLLPVCVYGLIFIFLGNTAGNSYICAKYFLRVIGLENPGQWLTKGVAVGIITFACLSHSIWRKGGIGLLNILAVLKLLTLWVIISLGYAARAGHFETIRIENPPAWTGFEPDQSFVGRSTGLYGWVVAILSVLYAFGGYENGNYVLSEIEKPMDKFASSTIWAMAVTGGTYLLTIVSYYLVIPINQLYPDENGQTPQPVLLFFERIFGDNDVVQKVVSGLVALSSFGNLMTVTFVAARVKQEIAKEGIILLPPYEFWRKEYDSGWRIIKNLTRSNPQVQPNSQQSNNNPETLPKIDKTPIPALILHWITSVILVVAPPGDMVYPLFTRSHSYMFQACFGMILGGGLLYLRYIKPRRNPNFQWVALSKKVFDVPWGFRPIALTIYFLSTVFLVIGPFIQHGDTGESKLSPNSALQWFVFPVVCFSLFGAGIIFWLFLDVFLPNVPVWKIGRKRLSRKRRAEVVDGNLEWEGIAIKWIRSDRWEPDSALTQAGDPKLPRSRSSLSYGQARSKIV